MRKCFGVDRNKLIRMMNVVELMSYSAARSKNYDTTTIQLVVAYPRESLSLENKRDRIILLSLGMYVYVKVRDSARYV